MSCPYIGELDITHYKEAMTKGYIESATALLILEGVTGSGKDLFRRLVLGLPVPEFSPSTPLAESAVRSISMCQVAVQNGIKWIVLEPQDMMDMVAKTIKDGALVLERQLPFSEKHADQSSYTFNATFLDAIKNIDICSELIQRVTKLTTARLMDVDFIYLLDSGGQPPFREMLPHFVQQASAIVLMQKLNEKLDFKPTIRYREEGGKVDKGYTSQLTNGQILHQYVQGVQSLKSKVFVVGTHRDKEGECENETREMKNEKLLKDFRPVLGGQMELYKVGVPDQLIFPVDCTSRGPDDEAVAEEFRKRIVKTCMGEKVKIPLSWFLLEQLLQLLAQKMEVKVLSIEECCEAAKQKLHMPHNVCEAAIRYLGKLNIIFYSPDILPGVVFSNAQVILDKITELVHCSHALRTGDEDTFHAVPSCMESSEKLEFRDFAQVTYSVLQKAFSSHYREDLFTSSHFMQLLEGLLIAGSLENGKNFIPSLLPDLPVEEIAQYRVTSPEHPAPLVIYYPKKWIPVGVMASLVVYLQNICQWRFSEKHDKPMCLYHNCIQFELPGGEPGNVVVIDSTKFLEIHVRPTVEVDLELYSNVKEDIISGLETASYSLNYDSAKAEVGFLCSGACGNHEVHLATVDVKKQVWFCSEDKIIGAHLDETQIPWMTNPRQFPEVKGVDIVARKMINVVPDQPINMNWKDHGFKINIPAGAFKRQVMLYIQASVGGDYELTNEDEIVSGIYWLCVYPRVERFEKKVTLTLQHSASDCDSKLTFITAKQTKTSPPYVFHQLSGGSFSQAGHGTIDVEHFCGFALSGKSERCAFCLYYIPKSINTYEAHITVTPDLELCLKVSLHCSGIIFMDFF